MTTTELAQAIGCHITTASRYRNGHRLPGVQMLDRIRVALDMNHEEIMKVWNKGPDAFGKLLRRHVSDDQAA